MGLKWVVVAPARHRLGRILPLRLFEPRFASHLLGIASVGFYPSVCSLCSHPPPLLGEDFRKLDILLSTRTIPPRGGFLRTERGGLPGLAGKSALYCGRSSGNSRPFNAPVVSCATRLAPNELAHESRRQPTP